MGPHRGTPPLMGWTPFALVDATLPGGCTTGSGVSHPEPLAPPSTGCQAISPASSTPVAQGGDEAGAEAAPGAPLAFMEPSPGGTPLGLPPLLGAVTAGAPPEDGAPAEKGVEGENGADDEGGGGMEGERGEREASSQSQHGAPPVARGYVSAACCSSWLSRPQDIVEAPIPGENVEVRPPSSRVPGPLASLPSPPPAPPPAKALALVLALALALALALPETSEGGGTTGMGGAEKS